MTGDQLALDLDVVLDVWAGEGRPERLWHLGDLGSMRPECVWRPVQTITLAPTAGVL